MRTIIAGSRGCEDIAQLTAALSKCGWTPTVVLCGLARGADTLGKQWAERNAVPVEEFPVQWRVGGVFRKNAGILRNIEMGEKAQALVALWDGASPGTRHMIQFAQSRGLKVYVQRIDQAPAEEPAPDMPQPCS